VTYSVVNLTMPFEDSSSEAGAINASGEIVGEGFQAYGITPYENGILWSPSGTATVLQDIGGQGVSFAEAINDAGQIVGYSETANGYEAVLWQPTGKALVLQDAGGGGVSFAEAINDAGQIVGVSKTASGGQDAVLWSPTGRATVLQDVGGAGISVANAINDAGQSVGVSFRNIDGMLDAVLWSPDGRGTVLQNVGGSDQSYANAINNSGQSVGESYTASNSDAVLWPRQARRQCFRTWGVGATALPPISITLGGVSECPRPRAAARMRYYGIHLEMGRYFRM
jgi:probable HAF family extracellular repeat protein